MGAVPQSVEELPVPVEASGEDWSDPVDWSVPASVDEGVAVDAGDVLDWCVSA
ncbi:hypothetical protein GCM10009722_17850 [Williamsia deligens]